MFKTFIFRLIMSKNWNDNIEVFASKMIETRWRLLMNIILEHIQIYKTLALRWQVNVSK